MKRISYLLMIIFTLGLVSCGKDGSVGPTGPLGQKGDKGDAGVPGAAGRDGLDGKTILNGTSNPTATVGKIGDFYISTNSYLIYGPKTASGWGSGKSILGATGAKGDKGDKGDTGSTGATGAKGDKGDKGDTGSPGATGAKGDKGDKGDTGATGAKGDKGDKGEADYVILSGSSDPTDAIGNTGDFYFNTTTKTLFYRYIAIINTPAWGSIAKLSNTIQFSTTINMSSTANQVYIDFDLPKEKMENSIINVYVRSTTTPTWYPLPGYISNSDNEFRITFNHLPSNSNKTRLTIYRVSGNGAFTNAPVRILVTEAEVFRTIYSKVDFGDYNDVKRYFQLGN